MAQATVTKTTHKASPKKASPKKAATKTASPKKAATKTASNPNPVAGLAHATSAAKVAWQGIIAALQAATKICKAPAMPNGPAITTALGKAIAQMQLGMAKTATVAVQQQCITTGRNHVRVARRLLPRNSTNPLVANARMQVRVARRLLPQ